MYLYLASSFASKDTSTLLVTSSGLTIIFGPLKYVVGIIGLSILTFMYATSYPYPLLSPLASASTCVFAPTTKLPVYSLHSPPFILYILLIALLSYPIFIAVVSFIPTYELVGSIFISSLFSLSLIYSVSYSYLSYSSALPLE